MIDGIKTEEDLSYEINLRPRGFDEYVGQDQVKENLKVAIAAAQARRDVLDHILFHGPPGLGKTSLAYIIAREMGVNIKATSGPVVERPGDLAALLTNLDEGDVCSSMKSTGSVILWRRFSIRRWRTMKSIS